MKKTNQVEELMKLTDLIYKDPSSLSKESLEKKIDDLNGDLSEGLNIQYLMPIKQRVNTKKIMKHIQTYTNFLFS